MVRKRLDETTGQEVKYCPHCKRDLPPSEFYRSKNTKDGLHGWCKQCCKNSDQSEERKLKQKMSPSRMRNFIDSLVESLDPSEY
jgi:predicted sulfurtransferase